MQVILNIPEDNTICHLHKILTPSVM